MVIMAWFSKNPYEGRRASEIYADSSKKSDVNRIVRNQCKDSNAKNKGKK